MWKYLVLRSHFLGEGEIYSIVTTNANSIVLTLEKKPSAHHDHYDITPARRAVHGAASLLTISVRTSLRWNSIFLAIPDKVQ